MNARYFPCPYCKGQGGEGEVICDDGTGPWYDCGVCRGNGMIQINGPIHQEMKKNREAWQKDTADE